MSNTSVCFRHSNGIQKTFQFSPKTTIKEMIQQFFKHFAVPPERRERDRIIFLFNGSKIPIDSQASINEYFHNFNNSIINILFIEIDDRLNA